jgi:hypothetical protein
MNDQRRFLIPFFALLLPQLALYVTQFLVLAPLWRGAGAAVSELLIVLYYPIVSTSELIAKVAGIGGSGWAGLGTLGFIVLTAPLIGSLAYSTIGATLVFWMSQLRAAPNQPMETGAKERRGPSPGR